MGEKPTTVNKTLGVVQGIINTAVMKVTAPLVVQMISSIPQLSFLKLPIISQVFSYLIHWILGFVDTGFQVLGIKVVLTIQTETELKEYSEAEGNLRKALVSGDPNEIEKCSQAFDEKLGNLIHWDGSSPIHK